MITNSKNEEKMKKNDGIDPRNIINGRTRNDQRNFVFLVSESMKEKEKFLYRKNHSILKIPGIMMLKRKG